MNIHQSGAYFAPNSGTDAKVVELVRKIVIAQCYGHNISWTAAKEFCCRSQRR
jgi:hypothetical protein